MKRCPKCQNTYTDDSLNYCLQDGTPLVPETSRFDDQAVTLKIPANSISDSDRATIITALSREIDTNLDLLNSAWIPVEQAVKGFPKSHLIASNVLKVDAIRKLQLPTWKKDKWQALMPQVIRLLASDVFEKVDRFYSRLDRLTDKRSDKMWVTEADLIFTDLLAEGNPLNRK
jgi:hypothetical protein